MHFTAKPQRFKACKVFYLNQGKKRSREVPFILSNSKYVQSYYRNGETMQKHNGS